MRKLIRHEIEAKPRIKPQPPYVVKFKNNMKINDFFDKIYCINLDRRTDRWESCIKEFKKNNMTVERTSAVDGKDIQSKNDWMTGPRIGCCKSHVDILKKMIENNWKKILILEDDIEFIDNFREIFCEKIAYVPNYDILYLCGNNPKNIKTINEYVAKTTSVLSTGAYAVSINFAQNIIPKIEEFTDPIDCIYAQNTPNYKCYIFKPYLSTQKKGFSDIENRVTDYSAVINSNYST